MWGFPFINPGAKRDTAGGRAVSSEVDRECPELSINPHTATKRDDRLGRQSHKSGLGAAYVHTLDPECQLVAIHVIDPRRTSSRSRVTAIDTYVLLDRRRCDAASRFAGGRPTLTRNCFCPGALRHMTNLGRRRLRRSERDRAQHHDCLFCPALSPSTLHCLGQRGRLPEGRRDQSPSRAAPVPFRDHR